MKNHIQIHAIPTFENFIVMSDVHLKHPDDARTQLFISTLNHISQISEINAVFLLGDIFDFIGVGSPYFLKKWQNVFQACKNLQERNIKVYFIEGNHDFGFHHFKHPILDEAFTDYRDAILVMEHPILKKVCFRHGDELICDNKYLHFRRIVKSRAFQKSTLTVIPGKWMDKIFTRYAKISRAQDHYRKLDDTFFYKCLDVFFLSPNLPPELQTLSHMIFGHIHQTIDIIHHNCRVLVGPDWFGQPSYLKYSTSHGFERVYLK